MDEQQRVSLTNQPVAPGALPEDVPVDAVPLPSKGLIYPPESGISGAQTVDIRSMTAKDEDILTSKALIKQGRAIDTLLKSCILNKSIDVGKMVSGDRNALLIAIRVTGYGPEYKVKVQCPKCGELSEHEFMLDQLEIKSLDAKPLAEGRNEFSTVLPVSKKVVNFKLLTGDDEKELGDLLEKQRKLTGQETPVTTRLIFSIVSIAGETDRSKIARLVSNMPAKDSRFLRTKIDEISPGVKMEQKFRCGIAGCGEESEVTVPIGTEFFWPGV